MSSTPTEPPRRRLLTYRPAIDGLRALAVVAVVTYHALPQALPGGWFGVDVFFVISGYLITSLLLAEFRSRRGKIDLIGFWRARARRLLPALFLVVSVVLAVAPFVTPRGRLDALRLDILATLAYVANWRFVFSDEAYFGQVSAPSALRHAWSLGVEEQFYIAYPLLLMALLMLVHRRTTLVAALSLLAAASAVLMVALHHPGVDPSRVYYGTDTRAHQLLVGAAVAAFLINGPGGVDRGLVRSADRWCRRLALPAMTLVLGAFWWAGRGQDALFEGGSVFLSIMISIVLVAASSSSGSFVQRLLSWEPLRRVGVVSYGIYLWHWPVIVFLNDKTLPVPTASRVAIQCVLIGALSWLSYRFVERPVRRGGLRALAPRVPRLSMAIGWIAVPAVVIGTLAIPTTGASVASMGLRSGGAITIPQPSYQPEPKMISVALLGNSVPQGLILKFRSANHPDLRLIDSTNVGCDPLDAPRSIGRTVLPEGENCQDWRDGWTQQFAEERPDVVLYFVAQTMVTDRIVEGQPVTFGSPEWVAIVEDGLSEARSAAGSSHFAVINLACHDMPTFNNEEVERVDDTTYVRTLNDTIVHWAQRENVPVVDQFSLLCPKGTATDAVNGVPLYDDAIHFTDKSAPIFWKWLAPRLQEISRGRGSS
ncbi:acyltransferase [Janibacter sp. LM]